MTEKKYNYILSAIMIILSTYVFATANKFPKADISQGFGAGLYPMLLSAVIFFCAVVILIQTIFEKAINREIKDFTPKALKKPFIFWILLMFFCILLKPIGFLVDACIYLLVVCVVLFRVKLWKAILASIIVPGLIWLVFVVVMHVPLPVGIIWMQLGLGG
jgi:hypothetical protein